MFIIFKLTHITLKEKQYKLTIFSHMDISGMLNREFWLKIFKEILS